LENWGTQKIELDPKAPRKETKVLMKNFSLLQAYPHSRNLSESANIPSTLLTQECVLETAEEPFATLVAASSKAPAPWNNAKLPLLATCAVSSPACSVVICNNNEQEGATLLERQLPKAEIPGLKEAVSEKELIGKKGRACLVGATGLAAAALLILKTMPSEQISLDLLMLIGAMIGILLLGTLYYGAKALENATKKCWNLRCPRPEMGEASKAAIAQVLKEGGWKELHLVWDAENNWRVDGVLLKDDPYKSKEILVVGLNDQSEAHVVLRIEDRTK
jgi:hypothetical protein